MKLGFEETQTAYISASQSARALTETWMQTWAFCPNCGHRRLEKFPNNSPVADFFCPKCSEEYELKSQRKNFGAKIVDGAYRTMRERLTASNNPNLILMSYGRQTGVDNLLVIPKQFFVLSMIEKRPPLSPSAQRAGWIGCNILLKDVPDTGKIYIVRNKIIQPRAAIEAQWRRSLFIRDAAPESRSWLLSVLRCVEKIGKTEFSLADMYAFEPNLRTAFPDNNHIREKIRQQLQVLRDNGQLEFLGRGRYHFISAEA